ncbi:MAG: arginine deiminase family protein [Sediminibacterium sp.]|nr:arginine deiminase family protein [Sediminibacterium sp.]
MIFVNSEVSNLKKILIHFPDQGLSRVVPHKAQDWLFEDIVDLEIIKHKEYIYYMQLLLYFLDPQKIKNIPHEKLEDINFYNAQSNLFHNSEFVIEIEKLLLDILQNESIRSEMTAAIVAFEECPFIYFKEFKTYTVGQLAQTFITGISPKGLQFFPPVPNFIFTRDIGIVIHNFLILNKPAKAARQREAIIMRFIFNYHDLFKEIRNNIIELDDLYPSFFSFTEDEETDIMTLEGGDVMMIHPQHVIIGISERTSTAAAKELANLLLNKCHIKKVTLLKIPAKRDFMHIDTIFTQVKKDFWVLYDEFAKNCPQFPVQATKLSLTNDNIHFSTQIYQFQLGQPEPTYFNSIFDLLTDVSMTDFGCKNKPTIVFSGNKEYPFNSREQWTDSCNLLALKEGVVIGYDRNRYTIDAFKKHGFNIVHVEDILNDFKCGKVEPQNLENTFILMPSAELSRARGGFHCMSLPLQREKI